MRRFTTFQMLASFLIGAMIGTLVTAWIFWPQPIPAAQVPTIRPTVTPIVAATVQPLLTQQPQPTATRFPTQIPTTFTPEPTVEVRKLTIRISPTPAVHATAYVLTSVQSPIGCRSDLDRLDTGAYELICDEFFPPTETVSQLDQSRGYVIAELYGSSYHRIFYLTYGELVNYLDQWPNDQGNTRIYGVPMNQEPFFGANDIREMLEGEGYYYRDRSN